MIVIRSYVPDDTEHSQHIAADMCGLIIPRPNAFGNIRTNDEKRHGCLLLIAIVQSLSVLVSLKFYRAMHVAFGWTSAKLITRIISLWPSLLGATTSAI